MTKYNATPTELDGQLFDSKAEARAIQELKLRVAAGEICCLETDKERLRWPLHALGGERICYYEADATYRDLRTDELVVADVKGYKTPMYRLKKKWMLAEYDIEIKEL